MPENKENSTISSPRTQHKRPADFTGRQTEKLNEELKSEREARSREVALVNAEQEQTSTQVIDYTGADEPLPELEIKPVEINEPFRTIRVNTKIEQMTFGRQVLNPGHGLPGDSDYIPPIMGSIPQFNFEEGRSYRVPREMAEHLQKLGYLAYIA